MKILDMALKKVYLEPTRQGAKKEEHRDMSRYWTEKLVDVKSYAGMSVDEIRSRLIDGTIDFRPSDWTHIRFHESGGTSSLLVEIREICYYRGHYNFHIHLGEVLEVNYSQAKTENDGNDITRGTKDEVVQ